MHRKIQTLVSAKSLDHAITKSISELESGMEENILADGNITTLVGEHTPLSPTTYFNDNFEKAGYTLKSKEAEEKISESIKHTIDNHSTFVYHVDDKRGVIPIPQEDEIKNTVERLRTYPEEYWIVTFDLRYDFDATPYKTNEIVE